MIAWPRGTVTRFVRARAFGVDTARKPASLGIEHVDFVHAAARRGLLVATADGRYYVNAAVHRRRRRTFGALAAALGLLLALAAAISLLPGA